MKPASTRGAFRKRLGADYYGRLGQRLVPSKALYSSLATYQRRRRRSLVQLAFLSLLLVAVLAFQYRMALYVGGGGSGSGDPSDASAAAAVSGGLIIPGALASWLSAPWRLLRSLLGSYDPSQRDWAIPANVKAFRTAAPPPWDVVSEIRARMENEEYVHHNQDCSRVLVYNRLHPAGFGSQFNQMLTAYLVAMHEHRAFVVDPNFLVRYMCNGSVPEGQDGYATCFDAGIVVGPPACRAAWASGELPKKLFPSRDLPLWTESGAGMETPVVHYETGFLPSVQYHGGRPWNRERPIREWRYPLSHDISSGGGGGGEVDAKGEPPTYYSFLAWKAFLLSQIWKFQPEVAARIDALLAPLEAEGPVARPLCALQVRRGDKVGIEAQAYPLERYLALLQGMTAESGAPCKTLFVATDDQVKVLPELQAALANLYAEAHVLSLTSSQERRGHSQGAHDGAPPAVKAASTVEFLAELTALSRADFFVGSASSNVGKLALVLRAMEGFGQGTAKSVDDGEPDKWELP